LFTVAGIIDNGYIGEIKVAFYNGGEDARRILVGEKISQMVLIPTVNFSVEEVNEITSADARGDNGFGSTGR
jgi:dUTP pyrophosphatase